MKTVVNIVNDRGSRNIDPDHWDAFYYNSMPSMLGNFVMDGHRVEFKGDVDNGNCTVYNGETVIHQEQWETKTVEEHNLDD